MSMRMNFSTVPAEKVFPLLGVFGPVAVSRRGALTVGWELFLPPAYSVEEKEYDEMLLNFAAAIKVLPDWTVVHRQDIYTYEDYAPQSSAPRAGFLAKSYDAHFKGRRYLTHRAYLFVSFAPRGQIDKAGRASGLFGINGSVQVPPIEKFRDFRAKCDEFIAVFATGGIFTYRQLTEEDWKGDGPDPGIVQRYMMLGNSSPMMSHIALSPDGVSVHDKVAQAFVVGESDCLPGAVETTSRVQALSGISNEVRISYGGKLGVMLDCEHVTNLIVVVPSQAEVLRNLEKEKKKMGSGIKSVDNRMNGAEISKFLEDAYASGLLTVKAHLNVIAWGPEEEKTDITGKISAALSSMGIASVYNNYNTPVLYYAGIPSNAFEIGNENLMLMELRSALIFCPYESFERGMKGGQFQICDRSRNVPVTLDNQVLAREQGYIFDFNMFILGGSGTGKSFFTNFLLRQRYDNGGAVFIIDVGDSYEGNTAIIREESKGKDGLYLSWDDAHPLSFNVFEGASEWLLPDGTLQTDEEGGNFIFTLFQALFVPHGGWTTERKSILSQFIIDYLRHCKKSGVKPSFDGFYEFFDREVMPRISYVSEWENSAIDVSRGSTSEKSAEKLRELKEKDYKKNGFWIGNVLVNTSMFDAAKFELSLKEYTTGGVHGKLLTNPNPPDITHSDWTVIEVDKLSQDDPKYYSICILLITHTFDMMMRRDPTKFKTFVIEEAWKAIANETMSPYLRGLWKTARKFSVSATLVSQEVADVLSSDVIKTAILDNSSTKILLDQSNHLNTFDELQRILSLTDKDKNLVLSINRSNNPKFRYKEVFFTLGGKKSFVAATEVSPEEAIAYESAKDKKEPFLRLSEKLGSPIKAIRQIIAYRDSKQPSKQ